MSIPRISCAVCSGELMYQALLHPMRLQHGGTAPSLSRRLRRELNNLPDFECTTVQGTLQQRATPTAEWVTVSRSQLVKFAALDPDPALFSGFAHYQEMLPNALARQYLATQGDPQK
jgi:hypothetical protein